MVGAFRPRIADGVRQRALAMLAQGDISAVAIARELGIGEATVRHIRDEQYAGRVDSSGIVQFRRVKKRWYCESCEAWVMVVPCPACEARKAGRR